MGKCIFFLYVTTVVSHRNCNSHNWDTQHVPMASSIMFLHLTLLPPSSYLQHFSIVLGDMALFLSIRRQFKYRFSPVFTLFILNGVLRRGFWSENILSFTSSLKNDTYHSVFLHCRLNDRQREVSFYLPPSSKYICLLTTTCEHERNDKKCEPPLLYCLIFEDLQRPRSRNTGYLIKTDYFDHRYVVVILCPEPFKWLF